MFSHMTIGSNDPGKSKTFYDAVFGALGAQPGTVDAKGRVIYMHNGAMFIVTKPIDGQPASSANGGTIGFTMDGPEQAKAWHDAGVAAGGTSVEEPPGVRHHDFADLYLAYLRDPDGNKLCAIHVMPKDEVA